MMKLLIICSILSTGVFSTSFEDFEINNMIEIDEEPSYQVATFPYPYKDRRRNWVYIEPHTVTKEKIEVHPISHPVIAKPGLALSVLSSAKSAVDCFLTNGPALLVGLFVAFGFCQLTSVCSTSSFSDAQRELKSFASSDRLKRAAEFLEEAIIKYSSMQNNSTS